jgi:molybdopterin-containing oxidoreductase family iron-sulfur binding subunit
MTTPKSEIRNPKSETNPEFDLPSSLGAPTPPRPLIDPESEPGKESRTELIPFGKRYWRGMEELIELQSRGADATGLTEDWFREFPNDAAEWTDPLTRRQFLVLMGASLALAGVSGCSVQPAPAKKILPYVRQPSGIVPGRTLYFATAMTLGGFATGLLVESHEGRPTKVEGNPQHPASLGATDVFAQASILGLYDPDRSKTATFLGQPRGYSDVLAACQKVLAGQRSRRGAGIRVLTGTVTSPLLADQLLGQRPGSFAHEFPEFRWHQYEPLHRDNTRAGAVLAFGEPLNCYYDFTKADVIVSLEADFLGSGPGHLRYARQFAGRRRLTDDSKSALMDRLYVVESSPTITGAAADHRLALSSREVEAFGRALALEVALQSRAGVRLLRGLMPPAQVESDSRWGRWIPAIAKDLLEKGGQPRNPGTTAVLAGESQPPFVHALAHALNLALGNVGKTVFFTDSVEAKPVNQPEDLRALVRDMESGRVEVLFILGTNPVYDAPADLDFVGNLQTVPMRIHLGLYQDETAVECHWHQPETHYLESWGDARAFDGTVTIAQPLIEPLYQGVSIHEFLAALTEESPHDGLGLVRGYWREHVPGKARRTEFIPFIGDSKRNEFRSTAIDETGFERAWERALGDGLIEGTALKPKDPPALKQEWARQQAEGPPGANASGSETLEINFRADPTVYDGRFANNGWLQEVPKPLTKLTWDNAVLISPSTAERLGLKQSFGLHGGEHGEAMVDIVEVEYEGRRVRAPVWILPGHSDESITVQLGYGRTRAGQVGNQTGFNAYLIRSADRPWSDTGAQLRLTGERYTLACTQMHHSMEEREPVRTTSPQEYQHPEKKQENSENHQRIPLSLYPAVDSAPPKHKWGMVIDLAGCNGCSACVVACQAENNIPVIGKTEVTRGREMHWLRIDRYYTGDPKNADKLTTFFQPVPCMQCENAPCELVCPVGATVHSADGLNDMVYNRCVGTRYCSNNCPYKVRRFNFLEYSDYATESLKLGRNPEVTVRTRGVMEKCTYCVQRIRSAQVAAEIEGRPIRDGDVLTACQAVCPAEAIHFGDLNDTKSKVARFRADSRNYSLLDAELNTRPRTTYLKAIRNPNPDLT